MIDIDLVKLDFHQPWQSDIVVDFNLDNKKFKYFQAGSGDLYFVVYNHEKINEMSIDKFDNYNLYLLVDKLYNSIVTSNFIKDFKKYKEYYLQYRNNLYNGEKISFQSDAPINEGFGDEFIYNYLDIIKKEDSYLLRFMNNYSDTFMYSLNINTDRSRYGIYMLPFMQFYRDLKQIDNQMTIDEYLYREKVLKKER